MLFDAVLFDLDGVLIDSREVHRQAFVSALNDFGVQLNLEFHDRFLEGLSTRQKLAILVQEGALPATKIDAVYQTKQLLTKKMILNLEVDSLELTEGLKLLKSHSLKLALCSNTIRETLDLIIQKMNLAKYFDFSLSNGDVKEPKPSPEIYLLAMKKLKVSPEKSLIVEDSQIGMQAAKLSGAHLHLVAGPKELNSSFFKYCLSK